MKTPIAKKIDNIALRRWCIEQAAKWPVETVNMFGGSGGGGGNVSTSKESDLLGRAERLLKWVTTK